MPNVDKFISHAPTLVSLNLIYDGKVLDIKLDNIAQTGREEAGYNTLVDIVREGDPAEQIYDS